MKSVVIQNLTQPQAAPITARYCASFGCRLRGLMFRKDLPAGEGLLLVQKKDDKFNATIHMMFMRLDLCVVWINQSLQVVDIQYARRWGLSFTPRSPACYILELNSIHLNDFNLGDKIRFDDLNTPG